MCTRAGERAEGIGERRVNVMEIAIVLCRERRISITPLQISPTFANMKNTRVNHWVLLS